MSQLPARAVLYTSAEKEPAARRRAFAALLRDLIALDGQRLVIERREQAQDRRERSQIADALRNRTGPTNLEYVHCGAHEDPLLWVADAVAWSYGAGGEWRHRVAGLVDRVLDVDECD